MLISSSTDINSPIDKVWEVLTDISSYHKWNSFTPKIDININELNSDVMLYVKMNSDSDKIIKQKETLLLFEPE
ncbi:MAG: hypothetical protein ACI959_002276, partial [Limisphaerales bacterium]